MAYYNKRVLSIILFLFRCRLYSCWRCVDDFNVPVDWWVLYKPPVEEESIIKDSQYVYVTSKDPETGWTLGDLNFHSLDDDLISQTVSNALFNTLAPLKSIKEAEVAAVVYDRRPPIKGTEGTAAMGVLLANHTGGLWLSHTIPGFPNLSGEDFELPKAQFHLGQMAVCISLKLHELNQIGIVLQTIRPKIVYMKVPRFIKDKLPEWIKIDSQKDLPEDYILRYDFPSMQGAPLTVVYRTPGKQQCLYRTFAESFTVILDVYGKQSTATLQNFCTVDFGVRNIPQISYKRLLEDVHYISRKMDNSRFAITASAQWQSVGLDATFWICYGNVDNDDAATGAALVCLQDYALWHTMFALKVAEPTCPKLNVKTEDVST